MRSVPGAGSGSEAPRTAPDWRWALPRIAALFVATRLLLLAIAAVVEVTQAAPPAGARWTDAPLLASLTAFDGRYYLGIAASGYHAAPVYGAKVDYGFFPLYPILTRLTSVSTFGDIDLAGVLVGNLAFGLALVVLYALSVRHLSGPTALRSLVYLAIAPGAFAFGLAGSDSLLLLFAAGAMLAAERSRIGLAGLCYALATLARPPGILLGIPLLMAVAASPDGVPRRAWTYLLLGPAALAAFAAYLWILTGDPLAFVHAQSAWTPVATPGIDAGAASPQVAPVGYEVAPTAVLALWLGPLLFSIYLFVFFRRDRIPAPYWVLAALPILGMLGAGRLMSVPRFLAVAWPFDWVLASRRSRWVHVVVPVAFVSAQCALAWLAFTWQAAP
jgi:hypothetical protein